MMRNASYDGGCGRSRRGGRGAVWRRAADGLRREGWTVNAKRVRRLWRDEGLQVPVRRRKQRLAGIGTHVGAMSPIAPDALWACDFQFDRTIAGRQVKLCNIIDEYTREALAIVVKHRIGADDVVAVLDRLVVERGGPPAYVRFDNGPEFVAHAVADWASAAGTATVFIDPGSPWQNAWIESFNGRLRDELLNGWQFDSLFEAQVLTADWRIDYNTNRPQSSLNQQTPTEFATTRIQPNPHSDWTTNRDPLEVLTDLDLPPTQWRMERDAEVARDTVRTHEHPHAHADAVVRIRRLEYGPSPGILDGA